MSKYTFLCIDTETTGLPKISGTYGNNSWAWKSARLLELACVVFIIDIDKHLYITEQYSVLRKYNMNKTEQKSTKIHGITNQDLENGEEIMPILSKFMELYERADFIIGHNIFFDLNVMLNEFVLAEHLFADVIFNDMIKNKKHLCTARQKFSLDSIGRLNVSDREKYIRLVNLFGELFPNKTYKQHRALTDVKATIDCFVKMLCLSS